MKAAGTQALKDTRESCRGSSRAYAQECGRLGIAQFFDAVDEQRRIGPVDHKLAAIHFREMLHDIHGALALLGDQGVEAGKQIVVCESTQT